YSYLEHRWNFSVPSIQTVTVYANAWSGGSTDGDTFSFEYSTNGGSSWIPLFTISETPSTTARQLTISAVPQGTLIIRVIDTNRVAGHREFNTVFVDQLVLKP
ncbi:MAG: hypothetical protein ACREO9_04325, partial [Lysobacterales bacterium]